MTADRFVITGSGRCGTRWTAEALSAAGVPCGHEVAYSHDGAALWRPGLRGDSSWMAATMLDRVSEPVALLVRHPLAVVASWVEIGFFSWDSTNPTHRPLRAFAPCVYDFDSPADRALAMWIELTVAALGRAEMVIRVERMRRMFPRLVAWAGGDPARTSDARRIGRCNRHESSRSMTGVDHRPDWGAHTKRLRDAGRALAELLGYGDQPEIGEWSA